MSEGRSLRFQGSCRSGAVLLVLLSVFMARAEVRTPTDPASSLSDQQPSVIPGSAEDLAIAMGVPPADLVSASIGTSAANGTGICTGSLGANFPTQGNTFAILASGLATTATAPDDSESTSTILGGLDNGQGNDLVQLTLRLRPPGNATCLAFDFAFYSEEFPEWVGSQFNDAFTAEIGGTDLSIVNSQVVAPLNFAFDTEGNVISVNTVFGVSGNTDTTYDGATPLLRAVTPLEASHFPEVDLVFSIQDLGDSIYDSAVFLDNFQWLFNAHCEAGAELADSDGDALLDEWETEGVDVDADGTIDLDLPAMGADPNHKDIFVEVDYMLKPGFCVFGFCFGGHSHKPKADSLRILIDAFEAAPVSNPDGTMGIHLHIDAGSDTVMNPVTGELWGARSAADALDHDDELGGLTGGEYDWSAFDSIKGVGSSPGAFSVFRRDVFHYAVFAHDLGELGSTSGVSRGISASDLIVSLGSWSGDVGTVNQQAGTLMHELGHNLSLRHGGADNANYKPNYLSIMNYFFQLRGLRVAGSDGTFDYSFEDLPDLNEETLNETLGVNGTSAIDDYGTRWCCGSCGDVNQRFVDEANAPVDWNCDGDDTDNPTAADINASGGQGVINGFDDWDNIVFDGGAVGKLGQEVELPSLTAADEIDREQDSQIPTPYAVSVTGPGTLVILQGESEVYRFVVTNRGDRADAYNLETASDRGWADFGSVPQMVTLDPGASAEVPVVVSVPMGTPGDTSDTVAVKARSTQNVMDAAAALAIAAANPPVADAGDDQVVECAAPEGTAVTLDGSRSFAPSGNALSYRWTGPFPEGGGVVEGVTPSVTLPLGSSTVELRVNDGIVDSYPDSVIVTVADTTPPYVKALAAPDELWPPNHKMVDVGFSLEIIDACDASPMLALDSLVSNEPDDAPGNGDGSTTDDIQGADCGTGDLAVLLRAERQGGAAGRTYMATYRATDDSGNVGWSSARVFVPHDQGGVIDPVDVRVEGTNGTVVAWETVQGAQHYDVIRGNLEELRADGPSIDLGAVLCVEHDSLDTTTAGTEDAELPAPGKAFFYLVQFNDGLKESSYGAETAGKARVVRSEKGSCH